MALEQNEPLHLSVLYGFVRGRQLEGTYSSDPTIGVWPETGLRISYGWGEVPEENWPYSESRNWPPKEPPGLDSIAKKHRLACYQRIRSLQECKIALRKGPIDAAFEITKQWYDAKNGLIEIPRQNTEIVSSHAMSIFGFDDKRSLLHFKNSWGEKWGDKGYGWLPYEYFEPYLVSAWIVYVQQVNFNFKCKPEIIGLNHTIDSIIGDKIHVIEFYDFLNDERIGWCFALIRDDWLDVEEFFVRPSYRHQGYGKRMANELLKLSIKLGLKLRLWIMHSDAAPSNAMALKWLSSYLRLNIVNSGVRWARYRATLKTEAIGKSETIKQPSRLDVFYFNKV